MSAGVPKVFLLHAKQPGSYRRIVGMKEKPKPEIPKRQLEDLSSTFSLFSQITRELNSAYKELEKRYQNLNLQLQETNLQLRRSLVEKEHIHYFLQTIMENLSSGVVAVDPSGKITLFNRAAQDILGYPAGEAIGKHYEEVMGKGVEEELTLPYVLKVRRPLENKEKEVRSKSGKKISLGFSTSPLMDKEEELLGAVEVFFDLSELRRMEEEMMRVRSLATLGEMAAVVVHEVKNPLGGIRGFAELLERDLDEGDPKKRSVKKILEVVDMMDRIVKSLLDYTKPVKLKPHKVRMAKFIDEVISFFQMDGTHERANVRIVKKYPEDDIYCHLDNEQFRQILLNLLHNAVQAMPGGGQLTVDLSREWEDADSFAKGEPGNVVVKISDTGVGMSPDIKKKLFTPFFSTKEGGTGLGLSTVKKIVDAHSGDIKVESKEGKGTTVCLRLPVAQ
jgi:PAS domain S-box-containing protein